MDSCSQTVKSDLVRISWVFGFFVVLYVVFFSPIIFSDRLLAPAGDAVNYYLPNFCSGVSLWEPLLQSGYPMAADPQAMSWYPISLLLSKHPALWNLFIISAYVLASFFSYCYVYCLTESSLAGLIAGITYGMSGFMIAHLAHATIIHAAVWIPLIIWSFEKVRLGSGKRWVAIGSMAMSCAILAGHPQIFAYGMALVAIYTVVFGCSAPIGRLRFFGLCAVMLLIGLCLSAIQLIPTFELAKFSVRDKYSFDDYIKYSLPLIQTPSLLFPYLFGGSPASFYGINYFGLWNQWELAGYAGILPFVLAPCALLGYRDKCMAWFWALAAVFALLFALGGATPLAKMIYYLPVYNKFRVPARHLMEFVLALSVLAGLGVSALQRCSISRRLAAFTACSVLCVMGVAWTVVFLHRESLEAMAALTGTADFKPLPWDNPALAVPFVVAFVVAIMFMFWVRRPCSSARGTLLILVVIIDLASFGWFERGWRYEAVDRKKLIPSESVVFYRSILDESHQRLLPVDGEKNHFMPANLSRVWNVPNSSFYGPLTLSRVSKLMRMTSAGEVYSDWSAAENQTLNILGVRYVLDTQPEEYSSLLDSRKISWLLGDMKLDMGEGCGLDRPNYVAKFAVNPPFRTTHLAMVSKTSCSLDIADGMEVMRIVLTDSKGNSQVQSVRAGRDTSEWAYDCRGVAEQVKHRQARIFDSYKMPDQGSSLCAGHNYVTLLPLASADRIKHVELEWRGPLGIITVNKLSLVDDESGRSFPLSLQNTDLSDNLRWYHVNDIDWTRIYENLRAMPRAWLVSEVIAANAKAIRRAVQTSRLPDGRTFVPGKTALVEEPLTFHGSDIDPSGKVEIQQVSETLVELRTDSVAPAFLVLSDIYYPGWRVAIDGNETRLFQTNYVLRGVMVPAGTHNVRFEYGPISFCMGLAVSLLALFGMIVGLTVPAIKNLLQKSGNSIGNEDISRPPKLRDS